MRYIEEIIEHTYRNLYKREVRAVLDEWYINFVSNIMQWAMIDKKPLSTNQAKIALRVLSRMTPFFIANGYATADQISALKHYPAYRNPPTQSANIPREVRYLGGNLLGFRFKRDDVLVNKLKAIGSGAPPYREEIQWDYKSRIWIAPVVPDNVDSIFDIIGAHFGFDDEVVQLITETKNLTSLPTIAYKAEQDIILISGGKNELFSRWVEVSLGGERDITNSFRLPATSKMCRIISRASLAIEVDIDTTFDEFSKTAVSADAFPPSCAQYMLAQELIDFDLRANIALFYSYNQTEYWLESVLMAAKKFDIANIVMPSMNFRIKDIVEKHGFVFKTCVSDEYGEIWRNSLFIEVLDDQPRMLPTKHAEFPYYIAIGQNAAISRIELTALPAFTKIKTMSKATLTDQGFNSIIDHRMGFLFNHLSALRNIDEQNYN